MNKNKTVALILSIFLGGLGIDRFYLGYTWTGLLKLFTGGLFGILWIIDIILIAAGWLAPAKTGQYSDNVVIVQPNSGVSLSYCDELEKLVKLKEQGILSNEEYERLKANCLKKMG